MPQDKEKDSKRENQAKIKPLSLNREKQEDLIGMLTDFSTAIARIRSENEFAAASDIIPIGAPDFVKSILSSVENDIGYRIYQKLVEADKTYKDSGDPIKIRRKAGKFKPNNNRTSVGVHLSISDGVKYLSEQGDLFWIFGELDQLISQEVLDIGRSYEVIVRFHSRGILVAEIIIPDPMDEGLKLYHRKFPKKFYPLADIDLLLSSDALMLPSEKS